MSDEGLPSLSEPVGLFPLPNVVLFPGATLPLQIFEPRYRSMVRAAIDGTQLIAMAILQPGFEGYYYTNLAKIAPVVCVGRICEHAQAPDGRYFINLKGLCRARVLSEDRDGEYRLARLDLMLPQYNPLAKGLESDVRRAMSDAVSLPLVRQLEGADECRSLLQERATLEELVDCMAAVLLPAEGIEIKQRLLEEADVMQRVAIVLTEIQRLDQVLSQQRRAAEQWPRGESLN